MIPSERIAIDPRDRRRSPRIPLELPLELVSEDTSVAVRTLLASRDGVLVYSPKLFPRGTSVSIRSPEGHGSVAARVVWSWVEGSGARKKIRLALERVDDASVPWQEEYERRLDRNRLHGAERRRHPRKALRLEVEIRRGGATQPAETFDVSEQGAGIFIAESIQPGTLLRVVRLDVARHSQMRVIWADASEGEPGARGRFRLGLEMVEQLGDFWNGSATNH